MPDDAADDVRSPSPPPPSGYSLSRSTSLCATLTLQGRIAADADTLTLACPKTHLPPPLAHTRPARTPARGRRAPTASGGVPSPWPICQSMCSFDSHIGTPIGIFVFFVVFPLLRLPPPPPPPPVHKNEQVCIICALGIHLWWHLHCWPSPSRRIPIPCRRNPATITIKRRQSYRSNRFPSPCTLSRLNPTSQAQKASGPVAVSELEEEEPSTVGKSVLGMKDVKFKKIQPKVDQVALAESHLPVPLWKIQGDAPPTPPPVDKKAQVAAEVTILHTCGEWSDRMMGVLPTDEGSERSEGGLHHGQNAASNMMTSTEVPHAPILMDTIATNQRGVQWAR